MTLQIPSNPPPPHTLGPSLRSPVDSVRDMASALKPRHKGSKSIGGLSGTISPVLSTSQSFPSLRSASSLSFNSTYSGPPMQQKLSGLASATRQKARDVWSRRKASVVELDTMATVREDCLDSPTIPGRPAMVGHQRSGSASNWRHGPFGGAMILSISPPPEMEYAFDEPITQERIQDIDRPISPLYLNKAPKRMIEEEYGDVPPAVPPKEYPEFPRERSRPRGRSSPQIPSPTEKPQSPLSPVEKVAERMFLHSCPPLVLVEDRKDRALPWTERAPSRARADTYPSQRPEKPRLQLNTIHSSSAPVSPQTHEGTRQEPEKERRSRPRRRKCSVSRTPLPHGVRPSEAGIKLQHCDIESLQRAAKKQTENFAVLTPMDVESLAKELSQIESRCKYLKHTQKSLREGRKTLHTRMLTYLRSSRSTVFSRESLLKQEEAIAELDEAIADWDDKVEQAEDRRMQLRLKLLEHAAAALSVPNIRMLPPVKNSLETPPGTPERPKRQKPDTESITVYALLADVEQEIGRMMS